jgi:uncharacterized protein YndB with AHSA1/START domain
MIDIVDQINAIRREVGSRPIPAGEGRTIVLRRTYDAPIEDVWSACTDPDRIARWFMPVTGDMRLGGKYQLEGNAGGEILRCEPPRLLKVSWLYGDSAEFGTSEVEVRLAPDGEEGTLLELEHAAVVEPERWTEFGPGAVGVGWDLALLGLGLHLRGGSIGDPAAWGQSAEAAEFMTRSSKAWEAAHVAAGATTAEAHTAAENTAKFYVPDQDAGRDPDGSGSA